MDVLFFLFLILDFFKQKSPTFVELFMDKKSMLRNDVENLSDIHTLFSDTLDFVLEFDGKCCDVGVLALGAESVRFATHFLQDEPEIFTLGAAFGERVKEQFVVATETRNFFVNVEFVCHNAGFLQQAHFVDFRIFHERVDAFTEFGFPRFNALRIENFNFVDDFVQVNDAAGEVNSEVRAFFLAHGNNAIQSFVKFCLQVFFPDFIVGISVGELQNIRDGKYVFKLDFSSDAVLLLHGLCDFDEFGDRFFIIAYGNIPGIACAKRNGQVHGTANEFILDLCFEIVFKVGKILRNLA